MRLVPLVIAWGATVLLLFQLGYRFGGLAFVAGFGLLVAGGILGGLPPAGRDSTEPDRRDES